MSIDAMLMYIIRNIFIIIDNMFINVII